MIVVLSLQVTDVWAPYGGYPKIVREGINENYLPIWLQGIGYNTYYSGKLWNQHSIENYNSPYAGGFNQSDFLLDPFTYEYRNAWMTRNGGPPVSYAGQYSPDLTAEKAYGFLEEALGHDEPFFLVHAPIASHGDIKLAGGFVSDQPQYAERHAHLFKEYQIPRGDDFNPEVQGGVSWVRELPRLNDTVIAYSDEYQRARLRSLQSVDEMVDKTVKILEESGQLDNTYIIYTTDNGYHIAQHRMAPGKECGFETDVHIPLVVRGPGIAAGHISKAVTSHTDLASTIMELAGSSIDSDGTPIPLTAERENNARVEHVTIEYWGLAIPEGIYGYYGDANMTEGMNISSHAVGNNTYKAIRVIGEEYNLYYAVWCTNETEFYDLNPDYGHLASQYAIAGRSFDNIVPRLDALMMVLKSCKGQECVRPWGTLHPAGDVVSLIDSLDSRYDVFYQVQPKVSFSKCELGYIRESEGPQDVVQFEKDMQEQGAPVKFRYQGGFSIWT
ncbi:hypothetical protein G7Z17_g5585 [Cylindrodendrum hubeiense]|uniref:Sulfatase N-terminal domain-containing protein n=1 Tax=Cylindrodendrum hubeiense TaxID=595255 RepID=A0A9P5HBL2_9HYPO|nr:hypothetical protein G7Z17_g5585 [Cylindrodendrum hubeiense]